MSEIINFIGGGLLGDFIHTLYVVKNICLKENKKANLYTAEGRGDSWRNGVEKPYNDLKNLILDQEYINSFNILSPNFNEPFIDLDYWRTQLRHEPSGYLDGWSDVFKNCYNIEIPSEYKWLKTNKFNETLKDKILIHRSVHRHNGAFPWQNILNQLNNEEIFFITSNIAEYEKFPFKSNNLKPCHLSTINDMAIALNSCKMFIGNQSAPFALASALDVPRLVELDYDPAKFYIEEVKYSNNISYFLNQNIKYKSNTSLVDF